MQRQSFLKNALHAKVLFVQHTEKLNITCGCDATRIQNREHLADQKNRLIRIEEEGIRLTGRGSGA